MFCCFVLRVMINKMLKHAKIKTPKSSTITGNRTLSIHSEILLAHIFVCMCARGGTMTMLAFLLLTWPTKFLLARHTFLLACHHMARTVYYRSWCCLHVSSGWEKTVLIFLRNTIELLHFEYSRLSTWMVGNKERRDTWVLDFVLFFCEISGCGWLLMLALVVVKLPFVLENAKKMWEVWIPVNKCYREMNLRLVS